MAKGDEGVKSGDNQVEEFGIDAVVNTKNGEEYDKFCENR